MGPTYGVEHLATFGYGPNFGLTTLNDGIKKLKQMEFTRAIWAQRMVLRLTRDAIVVEDENMELVEGFPLNHVREVSAHLSSDSSSSKDIYNNLLIFIVTDPSRNDVPPKSSSINKGPVKPAPSEMHIFQCVRISAEDVAEDIRHYLQGQFTNVPIGKRENHLEMSGNIGRPLSFPYYDFSPQPASVFSSHSPSATNFNGSSSTTNGFTYNPAYQPNSDLITNRQLSPAISDAYNHQRFPNNNNNRHHQVLSVNLGNMGIATSFERDVNSLNRNFDDIERFVARIQQAAVHQRELETRRRQQMGMRRFDARQAPSPRQMPPFFPSELEFMDIFQKFKYCFNLLAKLKNHIHEPNAPELLHCLFTPFALILDACTWGIGRHLVSQVYSPPIIHDAKILLENSLSSREKEIWISLGEAWTNPDMTSPNDLRNSTDFIQPSTTLDIHRTRPVPHFTSNARTEDLVFNDKLRQLALEEERIAREKDELARKEMALKQKEIVLLNREEHLQREIECSSRTTTNDHPTQNLISGQTSSLANLTPPINGGGGGDGGQMRPPFMINGFSQSTIVNNNNNNKPNGTSHNFVDNVTSKTAYSQNDSFLQRLRTKGPHVKIAQVIYDRTGTNPKELTVVKGQYVEILNDAKQWWECRNVTGLSGYVPHTILNVFSPHDHQQQQLQTESLRLRSGSATSAVETKAGASSVLTANSDDNSTSSSTLIGLQQPNRTNNKNGHVINGQQEPKMNGVSGQHNLHPIYPDCVASKIGARGGFRYF